MNIDRAADCADAIQKQFYALLVDEVLNGSINAKNSALEKTAVKLTNIILSSHNAGFLSGILEYAIEDTAE